MDGTVYKYVYPLILLSYVRVRIWVCDTLPAQMIFAVTPASAIGAPLDIFFTYTTGISVSSLEKVCLGLYSPDKISPNISTVFTAKDICPTSPAIR